MKLQVNTFVHIVDVESVIRRELRQNLDRQQLWALILVDPSGDQLCLYQSTRAVEDGRHNWSPPQGRIGRRETFVGAACSHMKDRFGVRLDRLEYLGSSLRQFDDSHPRSVECREAIYHWVFAHATGYQFVNRDESVAAIRWHHYASELLVWAPMRMRPEKGHMFTEALKIAAEGPLRTVPSWSRRLYAAEAAAHG